MSWPPRARRWACAAPGSLSTPNQRITLQIQGQWVRARRYRSHRRGAAQQSENVTLGDVADVSKRQNRPSAAPRSMALPGVIMNIDEEYGANTLEVTRGNRTGARRSPAPSQRRDGVILHGRPVPPSQFHHSGDRQSALVPDHRRGTGGRRSVPVPVRPAHGGDLLTAIPISLLAAVVVVQHFGITLNTMTLGGLAIALGEVVDDAVIGVENIFRRLRENIRLPNRGRRRRSFWKRPSRCAAPLSTRPSP